jgi:acetyl esterase/lipase
VTGAGDHIPWYSQSALKHAYKNKAIVIAPDYPLGPEANYEDIFTALGDFLTFYKLDGCFEPGHKHWTQWLKSQIKKDITIDKDNIFIEGESAGGHAIITTLFLNADKDLDFKLPIKAVMLRYPMIGHYSRTFPITTNGKMGFMNAEFDKDEVNEYAKGIKEAIHRLETTTVGGQTGFVRTRTKGYAPEYMWAAPVLTIAGEWKGLFQRSHGGEKSKPDEIYNLDCLERVVKMRVSVDPELLPPIVIHHAADDANCPIADTAEFKEILQGTFPDRYLPGDEMVRVIKVIQLEEPDGIKGKEPSKAVGHGYDYWQENEPFQLECFKFVSEFWPESS